MITIPNVISNSIYMHYCSTIPLYMTTYSDEMGGGTLSLSLSLYLLSSMPYFCISIGSAVTYAAAYTKYMDKMGEATFDLGKRHDAAAGDGKLHQPKTKAKRGVNGGRVVRTAGRKDRHSKVRTAGGTRDRRVRLSPNTAVLFYDLQDRLGCDRPSKAIDWLMTEAKAAIDALGDPPAAAAANCNRSATTSVGCNELFSGRVPPPPLMSGREEGGDYQGEILSASPTPLELFDTNSEIVRLQRIFSWNHGAAGEDYSSAALHYSAAEEDFHAFAEREPLQSSYSRINSNYPQFQGLGFSDLPSSINYEE